MNMRLALVSAAVVSGLALSGDLATAAPIPTLLPTPKLAVAPNTAVRRPGSHYTVAEANEIRQCSGLSAAYDQATSRHKAVSPDVRALHAQGTAMCAHGQRAEGIAKLTTAVRDVGVAPAIY